ncbi:unnamed protein product [Brassica napus]|uniref:(rape) hypothetical protein n=1 Tax=Brassica napus TaxID=3708 RepID=A0A816MW41_BRANA|nr:unnamed protein product [Brassica napus]
MIGSQVLKLSDNIIPRGENLKITPVCYPPPDAFTVSTLKEEDNVQVGPTK